MYRHCESRKARGNLLYCFLVNLVSLGNLGIGASLNSLYSLFSLNSLSLAPKLFSYCKFSKNSPTIMQLSKIISKFALQSSECRHNYAESVSLFSRWNLENFAAKRIGKFLASYHLVWRGVVAYFICRAFQSLIVKISFQHHAFFFMFPHWVLVEMKI